MVRWLAGRGSPEHPGAAGEGDVVEKPEILMSPGPTPVPPQVLLAQGSPLVYHRGPGYGDLLREVTENIQRMMKTSSEATQWSPSRGRLKIVLATAAIPEAQATAASAPSSAATFSSSASVVGFEVRV